MQVLYIFMYTPNTQDICYYLLLIAMLTVYVVMLTIAVYLYRFLNSVICLFRLGKVVGAPIIKRVTVLPIIVFFFDS